MFYELMTVVVAFAIGYIMMYNYVRVNGLLRDVIWMEERCQIMLNGMENRHEYLVKELNILKEKTYPLPH
jgi:hypothetical protein